MSQQNIEVVGQAISAINEGDVDAYLALCQPDFELINQWTPIEGPTAENLEAAGLSRADRA